MTPEDIVRSLAASEPFGSGADDFRIGCSVCDRLLPRMKLAEHLPACPYRLAVEWVEANPELPKFVTNDDGRLTPLSQVFSGLAPGEVIVKDGVPHRVEHVDPDMRFARLVPVDQDNQT